MTKSMPKYAFLLLCIFVASAVVSAVSYAHSGVFLIKVNGTLERTDFNFYASDDARSMSEEKLISLTVQKRVKSGWQIAWRIQGESSVSSVSYGVIPSGMTQGAEAVKFSKGCKYRVVATSESALGPNLYATSYFSFDENGEMIPSPRIP